MSPRLQALLSPFLQKFLEIDRRQGGDVAPPSRFIYMCALRVFTAGRRDPRPDLSFCQIRQKHETEVATWDSQD
jgi:hypothetical protein